MFCPPQRSTNADPTLPFVPEYKYEASAQILLSHFFGLAIKLGNSLPYIIFVFFNMSAAATLRKLLAREGEIVASPGVYDGVTARLALNAGFDTLYMVSILLRLGSGV